MSVSEKTIHLLLSPYIQKTNEINERLTVCEFDQGAYLCSVKSRRYLLVFVCDTVISSQKINSYHYNHKISNKI